MKMDNVAATLPSRGPIRRVKKAQPRKKNANLQANPTGPLAISGGTPYFDSVDAMVEFFVSEMVWQQCGSLLAAQPPPSPRARSRLAGAAVAATAKRAAVR